MRQTFEFKAILGILIWIGILAIAIILARQSFDRAPEATAKLAHYVGAQRHVVSINLNGFRPIRVGDLVYESDGENVAPIGSVTFIEGTEKEDDKVEGLEKVARWVGLKPPSTDAKKRVFLAEQAQITFFGTAPPIMEGDVLEYHNAPDSTAWVLQTMLHDEKRKEIGELLLDSFRENQADIVEALKPVVTASLKEASAVIRADMKTAFEARKDLVRKISDKYQSELVEKELVPLVQEEIWPIVEEESRPLATQVGQEIWSQVSVFRFGWRYLYDKAPLPDQKLTEKEFKRFVDEKAIPILQNHVGDFLELQKTLVQRIASNEKVKSKLSESAQKVANDPLVQQLLSEVAQEVFINNDRLQNVMRERWSGPEAQRAMQLANQRLEPTITEIGVSLFGSPQSEITPEFARVLRHRILHKDSRWFTLVQPDRPVEDKAGRTLTPKTLPVRVIKAHSEVPYAPARDRN